MAETRWKIEIPVTTPTQNEWQRMHWAARSRLKKKWGEWLKLHALEQNQTPSKALGKREVFVVRHSVKVADKDNLECAGKLILDPMRSRMQRKVAGKMMWVEGALQWIIDDDPKHVEFTIIAEKCSKFADEKTVILISEDLEEK